jgi:plasmid rolling circle replication initiator protein Rep
MGLRFGQRCIKNALTFRPIDFAKDQDQPLAGLSGLASIVAAHKQSNEYPQHFHSLMTRESE